MTKVLLIGRAYHPDGKETVTEIADGLLSLPKSGLDITMVYLKNIIFYISNHCIRVYDKTTNQDLKDFDVVLMTNWFSHASVRKDMALTLALYFEHHGVPQFNSEALHSRSTSKLSQMMHAALNDVPIPATLFSLSFNGLIDAAKVMGGNFTLPVVLKDAQASRGNSNYVLNDWDDAAQYSSEHSERHPFMIQSMIQSDGSDYRLFITGGSIRFAIHRVGTGDTHLNNTSAGASTAIVETENLDKIVRDDAVKASRILRREMTGLDIMFDTNGDHFFLEANPIPQIATGSNVQIKLKALADGLTEAARKDAQK